MNKIQKIFQKGSENFIQNRKVPSNKISVIDDIVTCRTYKQGTHKYNCPKCDYTKLVYNSCGNRHCSQCQNITKEQWVDARKSELINTPYFHVVFTLPDILNPIIYANQRKLYNLMFLCAKETLLELALDKKYLGAQLGITAILHTWSQTLSYHPHIHCIVPGGGLFANGFQFKKSKKKFFIPSKVLSRKFKGKFLSKLKTLVNSGILFNAKKLDYHCLISQSYNTDWVAFCKETLKSPNHVIEYLSRYSHKVAISDSRIVKFDNNSVTFKWLDNRDGRQKLMTLSISEFIRRFLLHVLPKRFVKIRYFGLLSTRTRKTKLLRCQLLTKVNLSLLFKRSRQQIVESLFGEEINNCPACGHTLNRYFLPYEILLE